MKLHSTHFSSKKQGVASRSGTPQNSQIREMIRLYPEVELAIEIINSYMNEEVRVTGCADWDFGYSGRNGAVDCSTFLVAMEAKWRDFLFSLLNDTLLMYLAILSELHIKAGKKQIRSRKDFYLDKHQNCFMAIDVDWARWIILVLRCRDFKRRENYRQFHRHYSGICHEMLSDRETH